MDYENVISDFADRTSQNLAFVRNAAQNQSEQDPQVYEFTQHINSLLGLLVFPQQDYFDHIPKTSLSDLVAEGWASIKTTDGLPDTVDNLKGLVRYLRNGIAHFNIKFLADTDHRLMGIRIWNTRDINGRKNVKTWEATLSTDDLDQLTGKFIELLLKPAQDHTVNDGSGIE